MEMAVTDEGKKLAGAEIKVFKNGSLVETVLTDGKGLADIPCEPNSIYTIEIGGNKGMIKKKIEINTNGVAPETAKGDLFFPATVELFEKIEGMDVSILDKPIGKIKFNEEYGFESDAEYTKSVQRQLAALEKDFIAKKEADQAKKAAAMKQYEDAIKIADKAFSSEEWEKAAEQYRIAEKVNPDPLETYPSFQLAELKTKLIKIDADNKRYDEAIGKADAAVASKNYEIAIAEYKRATGYKPDKDYPQTKIKEVQNLLANAAKVEQSYLAAIEKGDNALKINDLSTAKAAFEEAVGLKSDEAYPKNKVAEIDDILAKQEAKKAEYDNAIKTADDALAAKDYKTAKLSYEKASTLRPTEQYPKDQIGRVDALIAGAVKLDQDYLAAVEKGDNALKSKSYNDAKIAYETAVKLKPSETYPKDKIKEINDFIAKNEAAEKEYQTKIAEGDKALASKNYDVAKSAFNQAKTLKPSESYPQEKITEIDGLLANLAKVETNYKAAIAKGDAAVSAKDFEGAKVAFNEALSLKAEEQYPKDKLAEIETIVLKNQKSEEEYKTAVQNGDDALADKNYEKAKEFYNAASVVKPAEAYPKSKLAEIEKTIAQAAEQEKAYNDAIAEGDQAMGTKELEKAKSSYAKASGLKPEESYPKDQISKIETQLAANKELEANYAAAVTEGDVALSAKEYEKAKTAYKKASTLKAEEEYPKSKLSEIAGIIAEQKGKEESYNAAIAKGDAALKNENYEGAKAAFEEAIVLKDDTYPKGKITEIEAKLKALAEEIAANKKLDADYQAAVANGDQLGAGSKFDEAIAAYSKASELKPEEAYPREQIEKLKAAKENAGKEAELAEVQKQYDDKIAAADKAFKAGDLEIARTEYQAASSLKAAEGYPKEKIKSINTTLADTAEEDKKYKDAISLADKFVVEEKWQEAKVKYTEALNFKPDQEFPKEKIKEIDERLAELAAEKKEIQLQNEKNAELEANYSAAIAEADELFNANKYEVAKPKYEAALALKEDQYPKDKIKEIGLKLSSLAEQQAAAEAKAKIDAEYDALIAKADGLFKSSDFETAKSKYTAAIAVKNEQYPKDKIAEVDTKIALLAGAEAAKTAAEAKAKIDAEYNALVTEADKLFDSNDFKNAKSKYTAAIAVKNEQYPKDKIAEADTKLAALAGEEAAKTAAEAQAKIDAEFDALIAEADAYFARKEFKPAKVSYEAALSLKDEQYPKDQINKIGSAVQARVNAEATAAKGAKLDQDYLVALEKGDQALAANDLENALKAFQNALNIKPEETYPPQKIAEIDGLIAKRSAASEAQQAELNKKYDALMQAGKIAKDAKEWSKAISSYEQAKTTLPGEELPSMKIKEIMDIQNQLAAKEDEIRLRKEQAAANESSYQTAIANGDKYFREKNYNDAENEYRLALGLKAEETYPQEQLDKIKSMLNQMNAAKKAEQNAKKATKQKEQRYQDLITQGDNNFKIESYQNAKSNFENALRIKTDEEYPKTQIGLLNELIKKLELAEEEKRKNLDKPIEIQKGPKATITVEAEDEIERIYKELWAKQNSEKNAELEEQEEVLAKVREDNLEKEEARRQNAIERLEEISVSVTDQFEISSQMNLQNYETVKEQESDLQNTHEERVKAFERKREGSMLDENLLAESISLYNQKRMEETVEGKKDMVENEYSEVNESTQNRDKKQNDYILDTQQKFEDLESRIMKFHQGRSTEFYPKNYEEILEDEEDFIEKTTEYTKSSADRRSDYQSKADNKSTKIKQFAGENTESFKNNQLDIEGLEEDLKEQTIELVNESKIRRKKNEEEEFYIGEKKERQDQSSANYPQGVTEEVLENQNNSTTIKRIVVEGTQTDIYEKTLYKWGGVFHTKNGTNITEDIWDKESR
ncbi:MAG: tetratricopeptide (TPR) repeat protein [Vicingaceae bacterium]|jgi:tetratricopeptide (TPR) repeat protein